MSCDKGTYSKGQAYVDFSHGTMLDKLNIVNYTRKQICVSEDAEQQMRRLCTKMLAPQPVWMAKILSHDDYLLLLHLNVTSIQSRHLFVFLTIISNMSMLYHSTSHGLMIVTLYLACCFGLDDEYKNIQVWLN